LDLAEGSVVKFPAAQLRAARRALKLTQQQAADLTGGVVSARTWAETEKGRSQPLWDRAVSMWAAVGRSVIITEYISREI
jgi:DNA-binding XRE family transcriptional regulator